MYNRAFPGESPLQEKDRGRIVGRFETEARAFKESPFHSDPARLRSLLDFAGVAEGEEALDIACGPGIVAAGLRGRGASVTAIDLTPAMLREARGSGARLLRADATRLPFRNEAFDLVLCRNSFHHFPDPAGVAAEAARVLKPGGRLAYEDMAAAEPLPERDLQETIERLRDRAHARTLPPSEVRSLCASLGLRVERERIVPMTVDFEEWIDRPRPSAEAKARARALMESRAGAPPGTLRSWAVDGRLHFERASLLLLAVKA
jgi:ubiquinone/menaquinone biosynthesis C-methylase UbiE